MFFKVFVIVLYGAWLKLCSVRCSFSWASDLLKECISLHKANTPEHLDALSVTDIDREGGGGGKAVKG